MDFEVKRGKHKCILKQKSDAQMYTETFYLALIIPPDHTGH